MTNNEMKDLLLECGAVDERNDYDNHLDFMKDRYVIMEDMLFKSGLPINFRIRESNHFKNDTNYLKNHYYKMKGNQCWITLEDEKALLEYLLNDLVDVIFIESIVDIDSGKVLKTTTTLLINNYKRLNKNNKKYYRTDLIFQTNIRNKIDMFLIRSGSLE